MSISHNTHEISIESIVGPQLNDKVLAELEDYYPPINPSPTESMQTIMFRAGQRSVVEWIKQRLNEE